MGEMISKDWSIDMEKLKAFHKKLSVEQGGEEKPFINYVRHLAWNGQPCAFCGSVVGIHERYGRYMTGEEDEQGIFIEETRMYFCGLCLDEMEDYFEMDFG